VKSPIWLNLSNMIILAGKPVLDITDETENLQIFADPLFEKVVATPGKYGFEAMDLPPGDNTHPTRKVDPC